MNTNLHNASTYKGVKQSDSTYELEFEAFDDLPIEVRNFLNDCPMKISAASIMKRLVGEYVLNPDTFCIEKFVLKLQNEVDKILKQENLYDYKG